MSPSRPRHRAASALTPVAVFAVFALVGAALSAALAAAGPDPSRLATPTRPALAATPIGTTVASPLGLSCLGCHQPGLGPEAAAIDLADLDAQRLKAALLAYRRGEREGTVMPRLARGLTDAEIGQLARQLARR